MKLVCAQINQVFDNSDLAFRNAETFIQSSDADIVVFPEQYATGWRPEGFPDTNGLEIKDTWLQLAKKYQMCLVGSYYRQSDNKVENVALVCSPDGDVLAEYAKTHLFTPMEEDSCCQSGKGPVCFTYGGIKFGLAICFDLRFPELFRTYLKDCCQCVIVQAAWPASRINDWELLLRARALENRYYVIGSNCIGFDNVDYGGGSMICDFEGQILADAGVFEGGCVWDADESDIVCQTRAMQKIWT